MSKLLKPSRTRVEIGRAPGRFTAPTPKYKSTAPKGMRRRLPFALTPRFFAYLLLCYLGRLFTQALRSPLSAIFYVFLFVLPALSLVYLFCCRAAVQVYLGSGRGQGEKQTPIDFDMRITNDAPLPMTFVEADLKVPDENRVRCRSKRVRLVLLPFGAVDLAQSLIFPYRGEYEVGVSDVYVYDFFRLFRLRKRFDAYMTVYILPRKVVLHEEQHFSTSDVDTENVKHLFGVDRAEVNDIRTYIPGDHMKSIHWKLSSKSEELLVKQYAHHSGNTVYIFADMARVNPERIAVDAAWVFGDDVNEYVADGVAETAAAMVYCALRADHRCEILWFDSRSPSGVRHYAMETLADAEPFFVPLGTAGIAPEHCNVTKLVDLIEADQGVSYVFVSGRLDSAVAKGVGHLASGGSGDSVSFFFISPESRIEQPEQRERYALQVARNRRYLTSRGIYVTTPETFVPQGTPNENEMKGEDHVTGSKTA